MNKLSKEKKQQIIAVLVGAVVLVGCLWYFVIQGQGQQKADALKKIDDTNSKIAASKKLIAQTDKSKSDLEEAKKKLDGLEEGLASGDLYSWVINLVNKFRVGRKVDIRNFSKEEIIKAGVLPDFHYQGAKYVMTGTANFHDLGKFIRDFENMFPYFHIRNLEMSPSEVAGDEIDKLSFRMEIVALVKPEPPKTPGTP